MSTALLNNCFWVSTNPKLWKVDKIRANQTAFLGLMNDRGKKRKQVQCFEKARPGDRVLFYEGSPTSAIVAEGVVVEGLHLDHRLQEEGITLHYIRDIGPLSIQFLKEVEGLKEVYPINVKSNGTMFQLTPEEYQVILDWAQPEPTFNKDLVYLDLRKDGYQDVFEIKAGSLVARITLKNSDFRIPIQIKPSDPKYSQTDFERDLALIYDKFERLDTLIDFMQYSATLIFEAGSKYVVPSKFFAKCSRLGISIKITIPATVLAGRLLLDLKYVDSTLQVHIRLEKSKYGQLNNTDRRILRNVIENLVNADLMRVFVIFTLGDTSVLPDLFVNECQDHCAELDIEVGFEFACGRLTGRLVIGKPRIPIKIKASKSYQQLNFEKDLRILLEEARRLAGGLLNGMKMLFPTGMDLAIPDWFRQECHQLGVEIVFAGEGEINQIWLNKGF